MLGTRETKRERGELGGGEDKRRSPKQTKEGRKKKSCSFSDPHQFHAGPDSENGS